MNARDLQPAGSFASRTGVKMVAYGPAGAGKTPLINTAPRPVLMACEAGLLSMKGSTVPTWYAGNVAQIEEFMKWLFGSAEAAQFDTVCIDSISEMSEIVLKEAQARNRDGRAAYGELSRLVMKWLNNLYNMPNKHMYLTAKLAKSEEDGAQVKVPYFPGQDLNVKVVHMYDVIAYIDKAKIPNIVEPQLAIRTSGNVMMRVRDRSGKLAELEPPNLAALFAKALTV